ncbi:hypothetical protein [Altererythrobacter sp. GH1-8]|uniref:hypothetical protein n=1 Tax=Altererythrobacter sp. GH1-8 TaxID=3349333 RepID=UPI00374CDB11
MVKNAECWLSLICGLSGKIAKYLENMSLVILARPVHNHRHQAGLARKQETNTLMKGNITMFASSETGSKAFAAVFSVAMSAVFFAMAIVPASPGGLIA